MVKDGIKKDRRQKKTRLLSTITAISLSIFLAIITISPFIVSAENIKLIMVTTIILSTLFFFILLKLFKYYSKTLGFFVLKFSKNELKDLNKIPRVWFPSSIIAAISSLILFFKSNYVMWIYLTTSSSYMIDYGRIINALNAKYLPSIIVAYVTIGLILQSVYLKKSEKIRWLFSMISSLISVISFTINIVVIIGIISTILKIF